MSQKPKSTDPFFGLKLIAFYRTSLPSKNEDLDEEALINFAKWQICKSRNVLWNDTIWDSYTREEILTEFFAIKFDEDQELKKQFEIETLTPTVDEVAWFEAMEKKYSSEKKDTIKEGDKSPEPQEFEDRF